MTIYTLPVAKTDKATHRQVPRQDEMKRLSGFGPRACGSREEGFNLLGTSAKDSREWAVASSCLLTDLGQSRASVFPRISQEPGLLLRAPWFRGWTPLGKEDTRSCKALCVCNLNLQTLRQEHLELENSLGYVVKPFLDVNSKKAREDIRAGHVQAPTGGKKKRSLYSQAGWKLLKCASEIPHFGCDSAC